jgi:hypothetical protein
VQVFGDYHIKQEFTGVFLHCADVWFRRELPWNEKLGFSNSSCYFSVIQSTTGVSPGEVLRAFFAGLESQATIDM